MNKEKFEKDMAAFSFKQHQDVLTYLSHLKAKSWTIEDAQEWVREKIEERGKEQAQTAIPFKLCPECEASLQLLNVNFSPATQTGDSSDKSMWFCPKCGESIYNKKNIQTILREVLPQGG